MRNKPIRRTLSVIFIAVSVMVAATGCMPPDYSKEYAQKQAKEHQLDVESWFFANMPEAHVIASCVSVTDGVNLCAALTGSYRSHGKIHGYIYDIESGEMYLSENYDDVCLILRNSICQELKLDKDSCIFSFEGTTISFKCANDGEDPQIPPGGDVMMYRQEFIPAGISADDYAADVLSGMADLVYSFTCYTDRIPPEDHKAFSRFPSLAYMKYVTPIDLAEISDNSEGDKLTCSIRYSPDWTVDEYCHLEKIGEGLYIGCSYDITLKGAADDASANAPVLNEAVSDSFRQTDSDSEFTLSGSGSEYTVTMPKDTDLLIFSEEKLSPVLTYAGSTGKEIETRLDELSGDDCPGMDGYTRYGVDYVFKKDKLHGYIRRAVTLSAGEYRLVLK